MPFGSVRLMPGVNVERTPTLLEAGISQSANIRFKDSLVQKLGGYQKFYNLPVSGTPRDLHAWQDLNNADHLAIGTTNQLSIITSGAQNVVTPQTLTTNFTATGNFSFTANSTTVAITDANISNVTTLDQVYFNTPIYGGGLVLSGIYPITQINGTTSYNIQAAIPATITTTTAHTPIFTTTNGAATVSVEIDAHAISLAQGPQTVIFPIATTSSTAGVTVSGAYGVNSVTDANDFVITVAQQAATGLVFSMNNQKAQLVYYINLGPPAAGIGFGLGAFGAGGFGIGTVPSSQTGTPITATDWTSDNWGEILLTCPAGGGLYQFDPTAGFTNAALVTGAPLFNGGMFVSMVFQIVVMWGSTVQQAIGIEQDPLLVKWSTIGNFVGANSWAPLTTNAAGSQRIPTGSKIIAGMAVATQNLIWTDLDLWSMTWVGLPDAFGFNKISGGAGAISSHSIQQLGGAVFWMSLKGFFQVSAGGASQIPCPVWDVVFQNINTSFQQNVRAMPNTPFGEVGWLYPSAASSSGECDSYVKVNFVDPGQPWDYGPLARSAWTDQNVFGMPIAASPGGFVYQHETTNDADGSPLVWSWTTGYFEIGDGENFVYVDQVIPDFKLGTYSGSASAQIQLSFNVVNYPTDSPVTYGPYLFNAQTEYLSVGFRGRQMSITATGSDLNSFSRIGRIRYRWAPDGRA